MDIQRELIDTQQLPPNLQLLIDTLGFDAALKFIREYGGLVKTIPYKANHGHAYEQVIGRMAFEKLVEIFGGEDNFYVPKADSLLTQLRRHQAQQMRDKGASASQIAKELNISHRHAQRIKQPVQNPNLSLF